MKTRLLYLGLVVLSLTLTACGEVPTALPGQQPTATPSPTVTPVPTATPIPTATPLPALPPTPQPSGEVLAFLVRDADDRPWLYKAAIGSQGLSEVSAVGPWLSCPVQYCPVDMYPSHDGRYIALQVAFESAEALILADIALNGFFDPLVNGEYLGSSRFMDWTPAGDLLYVALSRQPRRSLWRINVHRDEGHQEFDVDVPSPHAFGSVVMSPDGTTILYSFSRGLGYDDEVWRMNADGTGQTLLWSEPLRVVYGFEYSPDGSQVAYMTIPDSPTPFPSAILWGMDADGSNRRQLYGFADGGHGYVPHWSPDGTRIVFVGKEDRASYEGRELAEGAINNVYIADLNTGTVQALLPLAPGQQHNYDPWWSLDGTQIVFISDRSGTDEVWAINADGTNLRQLTDDGQNKRYPLWLYEWTSSFLPLLWKGPQGENARPPAQC